VLDVKDEETVVVIIFAFQTDTLTADVTSVSTVEHARVVHTEDSIAIFIADVLLLLGCVAIDVFDETVSLFFSDEVEVIEERRARESVHRRVLGGRSDRKESGSADPEKGGQRGHCDDQWNERPN